ncbi:MAG: hypothetical protein JXA03_15535 [Bacteroidales bacterium]|nr:hypothetical protein [Bacteroidales bacterium]
MTDKLIGFSSGGLTGIAAFMTGMINLESILSVFVVAVVGGAGGIVGQMLTRTLAKKVYKKKENED